MSLAGNQTACWREIGVVGGDRSCEVLKTAVHCRNCEIYGRAAFGLMERDAPDGYLQEWAERIASPQAVTDPGERRAFVFRLQDELLALDAAQVREAGETRVIRRVPHVRSELFRGVVNVRGELLICITLETLLGVETASNKAQAGFKRLLVFGEKERWYAFEVDDVLGLARYSPERLHSLPVTLGHTEHRYSSGFITHNQHQAGLLRLDALLAELGRRNL